MCGLTEANPLRSSLISDHIHVFHCIGAYMCMFVYWQPTRLEVTVDTDPSPYFSYSHSATPYVHVCMYVCTYVCWDYSLPKNKKIVSLWLLASV